MKKHDILLYYKYTSIRNPKKFADDQLVLCKKLGLTGRIIVATEGINGTVEGTKLNVKKYIKTMSAKKGFTNVHWKISDGIGNAFPKLSIKVRSEIVTLGLTKGEDVDPRKITGKHINPEVLHKWLRNGEKLNIVDMRNTYEHKVGHFAKSILPPLKNFRDLKGVLPTLKHLKKEKVLTVCTGGVRCEKASGYLVKNGFKDVYQLNGGIVSYMKKFPGEDFLGALYVFDQRVTMAYKPKKGERPIIGKCEKCGVKTENYADCGRSECRTQFICCEGCIDKDLAYCSSECKEMVKNKQRKYSLAMVK